MTKFELAEMMGLEYDGQTDSYEWRFSYGIKSFNQSAWCEDHDMHWAEESAATEFFDYIKQTLNRVGPGY